MKCLNVFKRTPILIFFTLFYSSLAFCSADINISKESIIRSDLAKPNTQNPVKDSLKKNKETPDKSMLSKHNLAEKKARITAPNASSVVASDWKTKGFEIFSSPTIAYLFFILGIYGVFIELLHPGLVLPGAIGAFALFIGLYFLLLLPINYTGLSLIILGVCLIVAESFAFTSGTLGVGGTAAFILGSLLLFNDNTFGYRVAWPVILLMAVINILLLSILLTLAVRVKKQKVMHGITILVGAEGRTLSAVNPNGQAVIRGEIWNVRAKEPISANQPIRVIAAEGLKLEVEEIINEFEGEI